MRRGGFLAAGLVLFALPFLSMGVGAGHHAAGEPHTDHAPRYGGLLLMVGDYHLEVVEREETIEVYPSDAWRRPLAAASGRIVFDGTPPRELVWEEPRLTAQAVAGWSTADVEVRLAEGPVLAITVPRRPRGAE